MKKSTFILYVILGGLGFFSCRMQDTSQQEHIPDVPLIDIAKGDITKLVYPETAAVIILSAYDCPSCLQRVHGLFTTGQLNRLGIPVLTIVSTPYRQSARKLQEKLSLSAALYADTLQVLDETLGREGKPMLLLVRKRTILQRYIIDHSLNYDAVLQKANSLRE